MLQCSILLLQIIRKRADIVQSVLADRLMGKIKKPGNKWKVSLV